MSECEWGRKHSRPWCVTHDAPLAHVPVGFRAIVLSDAEYERLMQILSKPPDPFTPIKMEEWRP